MKVPSPIIDSSRLLYFAENDASVEYTGRISLFVGGVGKELEPIGEVPRLVITLTYYEPREYLLMFCDNLWSVKGVIPFTTIDEAKIKAERVYKGISLKWQESPFSDEEIRDYLRDEYEVDPYSQWWTMFCSFCGKSATEFNRLIDGQKEQICEHCVKEYFAALSNDW